MRHALLAGLMLLGIGSVVASEPGPRSLTFEDRVRAQAAIERVYYSHQLGATKPFEQAVPRTVLEAKVHKYLDQTAALEVYWKTAVTDEMLQRELERMASGTRMPERLLELYAALDNDPFLIKECLARATLVDRLTHNFYDFDTTIHAQARAGAEDLHRQLATGGLSPTSDHPNRAVIELVMSETAAETSDDRADLDRDGKQPFRRQLPSEEFRRQRAQLPTDLGHVSPLRDERDAFVFTVVLSESPSDLRVASYAIPKRAWDDWWETAKLPLRSESVPTVATDRNRLPVSTASASVNAGTDRVGSSGLPCALDDTWTPTGGAPAERGGNTAVWTGSLMVIWGGQGIWDGGDLHITRLNDGGRYDPATDTWTPTSTIEAPSARQYHSAVWTGTEMIVWGGNFGDHHEAYSLSTGGRYNPTTDAWTPTATTATPSARQYHSAVWTGTEMIVWGGYFDAIHHDDEESQSLNTGGRYDPTTDTWTPVATSGAPSARYSHTAVWTGSLMVVWGNSYPYTNTGGRYDPVADTWTPTSTVSAPSARENYAAVWTGSVMLVWGGYDGSYLDTGGRYDPTTNTWTSTSTVGAPSGRTGHTAVWTGSLMMVWGGYDGGYLDTGGRYNPVADTWTPMSTTGAPSARAGHTAVWTGSLMVTWGAAGNPELNTGGRYDPATDTWTPMSAPPFERQEHTAVWTGTEMIVWGGNPVFRAPPLGATGGRYDPAVDNWRPTSTTGAPSARYYHTAVWTGSVMLVWGGSDRFGDLLSNTGGRYDPATDIWTPTSTTAAPSARARHTAVWTGNQMVVWGGSGDSTGGRYDPVANTWTPTSTTAAPSARSGHTAVWTGSVMVVWGASGDSTGGRYDPVANTWTPTSTTAAPSARSGHTAVWTGSVMVVWGGPNSGGRYDPTTDSWTSTSTTGAPAGLFLHTAVWTGTEMIVWGGDGGWPFVGYGGRYVVADYDSDGTTVCQGDCDDANASVYPTAPEICDGLDNNCSGQVDEDASGVDSDSDGIHNACDNCRFAFNPDQLEADGDGVGNACDNCVTMANANQMDTDSDARGNICDNCPLSANSTQDDFDGDRVGDVCDNCIFDWNGTQTDFNHDGEGDICDLNDGLIYIYSTDKNYREWQAESGYTTWRSYRGSLAVLRATGQYTQAPGSNPLAARDCGVSDPYVFDPLVPNLGEVAFNLVTGVAGGVESGLGTNSAGVPRANANPCP